MLQTVDWAYLRTSEQMTISADYDAYWRASSTNPPVLISWGEATYQSIVNTRDQFLRGEYYGHDFRAPTPLWGIDGGANPFFSGVNNNFQSYSGSAAHNGGVALTNWPGVMAAANTPGSYSYTTGIRYDLGALNLF
jgi:hypothetical protein